MDYSFRPLSRANENSFNTIRLLAALQVVYFHVFAHLHINVAILTELLQQEPGVPIFFALSGCLVLDSCIRARSVRGYLLHRAARIYPALLLNIAILEVLMWLTGGINFSVVSPAQVVGYEAAYVATASQPIAMLMANAPAIVGASRFFPFYPSGVLWTLTVELTFYCVVPLLMPFLRSRIILTIVILTISAASIFYISIVGVSAASAGPMIISVSTIPYSWMFAVGMLFRIWLPTKRTAIVGAVLLMAALLIIARQRGDTWPEWRDFPPFLTSLQMIVVGLLALCIGTTALLKNRWLVENDVSYGVYLWHMLVVAILLGFGLDGKRLLLPLVVGLSLFAGWLSWLVEKRAIGAVKAFLDTKPVPQAMTPD